MKAATSLTVALLSVASLSLIHPWGNLRASAGADFLAASPQQVRATLAQKCGDCHSDRTQWPAYSRLAPVSWLVEHDVHEGREHLNFSSWEQYTLEARIDLLSKISSELRQRKMPLSKYLLLHPEARLSDAESKLIIDWAKAERRRLIALEPSTSETK